MTTGPTVGVIPSNGVWGDAAQNPDIYDSSTLENLGQAGANKGPYVPVSVPAATGGNDAAMIQAALTAAVSPGVVQLARGQTYLVNSTLTKPAGIIFDLNGSTIKANAAIAGPVVDTSPTVVDTAGGIRNGFIDCNLLARNGYFARYYAHHTITDLEVWNSTQHSVILGDSTTPATSTSYEAKVDRLHVWRAQANTPPVGYYGLWVSGYASDGSFAQVVVVGAETGIRNDGGDNKFLDAHVWGYSGKNPVTCFDDNAPGTDWVACTADTPTTYGWRLRGADTKILGGKVYNGVFGGSDNVVIGIQTSDQATSFFTVIGVHFAGADASHRIAKAINYTPQNGRQHLVGCHYDNVVNFTYERFAVYGSNPLSIGGTGGNMLIVNSTLFQWVNGIGLEGYSDSFTTLKWKLNSATGTLKVGADATANRPSASTAGAGAMFYDSTLGAPIFSDGTSWYLADKYTSGLLINKPAAGTFGAGFYFATDDGVGGVLYHSDASTWTQMSTRGELGYAEITANATSTAVAPSTTDVAGLSVTITAGTRPYYVEFGGDINSSASGPYVTALIQEGNTILTQGAMKSVSSGAQFTVLASKRVLGATPGSSHTYKVTLNSTSTNTASVVASATNPAWLRVREG